MGRITFAIVLACSGRFVAGGPAAPNSYLRQLRFSPNGRYVLAQNDTQIAVLGVQPFSILFRLPAENATLALFTPDSQQILFVAPVTLADSRRIAVERTPARVEHWNIAEGRRVASCAVPTFGCETVGLSPDGQFLACVDFGGTLRLIDVVFHQTIVEKKQFSKLFAEYRSNPDGMIDLPTSYWGDPGAASLDFSPDGRFLIAFPSGGEGSAAAWDLHERKPVNLPARLKGRRLGIYFAFIAADRLLKWGGEAKHGVVRGELVAFPSGQILAKPKIPPGPLFRAADQNFVLIRPFGRHAREEDPIQRSAALEIRTGQVIISETRALDVYRQYYVTQHLNGVVLFLVGDAGSPRPV